VKRFLTSVLTACLLASCATIGHGTSEVISVDSNPSGANVTIMSLSATSPATVIQPNDSS